MNLLLQLSKIADCAGAADNSDGTYRLDFEGYSRPATPEEIAAAQAAAARAAIPSVSIRQMHTALHRLGLLVLIKEYIAAANDIELEIAFASPTFERPNPLIGGMAQAMGKTDAEVDAIFALAASI